MWISIRSYPPKLIAPPHASMNLRIPPVHFVVAIEIELPPFSAVPEDIEAFASKQVNGVVGPKSTLSCVSAVTCARFETQAVGTDF
jgi:hypothetical protein